MHAHDGSEVSRLLRTPDHVIQGRDPHPAGAPDYPACRFAGEFP
jgi:hypothetical protein